MAFSLDMGQLASASSDGTIRFWDTEEGNLQWTVQEHSGYNNSIAFSPNGRRLASASSNFTVGLWDIEGRMLQATLERHSDIVNSVVFSPTGQLLASASDDRIVCIWNTGSRSLQKELVGHTEGVISVAFSPDGLRLVSASRDCTVRIWTIKGSSQRTLLSGSTEINSLAFSSDGCLLATASRGRIIRIWDASTGTLHREFKYHTVGIKSEISLNKGQQSSHRDSARIRAATIATSTESAHLNSGFRRTKGRSASSRQYQAPAQSSSQTPHHLTPAARASLPQRANTKSYPGLDRQVSDPWHPSRNNGTSRQYEVAAPIAYSTPLQGPHRGPHQGSYRGQQRGSQTSSRALDNYTTNVHQNATAIQGDPISWRSSPSGGRPWHHPRRSMPEPLSKEYGWGPRNSQSTSSLSRDNSNGGARSTHIGSSASKTPREYSDSHIEIHKLSFSNDGTHLITDIGIMKLEDSTSGTIPWPSYALDVEGSWITYKSEKVLLLPAEYRPTCQDFRDGAIALGSSSGRVTILRVDRVLQDVPIQDLGQMGRFGKQNSEWFPSENEGMRIH
jgi:WD40 repeat protein